MKQGEHGAEGIMSARHMVPADLPALPELGHDLLATTLRQRFFTLMRPFICAGLYALFAAWGWWPLAVLAVMLLFITIVATAHDLVHRALGLPRQLNEILLALVGMLVLESGHAYQVTHLQHHRRFPLDDDPEGDPARMSFWRALLEGPVFLFRLWIWAFRHAPTVRGWLLLEAGWFVGFTLVSIVRWPETPALLLYTLLVIVGSWVYPVATVHLPHKADGDDALSQTYTLRGKIIPRLFLELTYHLEHHLYPAVPSHNYAELARRLEPYLEQAGVEPVHVW
jgi:beta-carotene hydroxylase